MDLYSLPSSYESEDSYATVRTSDLTDTLLAEVVKQAQELQKELSQLSPSFFKVISESDVCRPYVLQLPREFCEDHIPKPEGSPLAGDIHLLAELGHEFAMNYWFFAYNLHGRWEDALVFHQIENYKFMIFIVRGKVSEADQSETSISSAFSTSVEISLNLPERARMKYYMLCASQKQFLHSEIKGLNSALVGGMIMQTISIVDEIKTANLTITPRDLEGMGNTLRSFEDLGLEIGFLRINVKKLFKLTKECQMLKASVDEKFAEIEDYALKEASGEGLRSIHHLHRLLQNLNTKSKLLDVVFKNIVDYA